MNKKLLVLTAVACMACISLHAVAGTDDLIAQIERMAAQGERAKGAMIDAIAAGIASNPAPVSRVILPRLAETNLTSWQLVAYVWAVGLSKDAAAVEPLIAVYSRETNGLVRSNCIRALGAIGGKPAADFLLAAVDGAKGVDVRFEILDVLARMQCEAALPKTIPTLEQDPQKYFWQPIFIFGKMGDKAVPFLLSMTTNGNRNVRANAYAVLGNWLIPTEATKSFEQHFWIEKDKDVRRLVLSSLERLIDDLDHMKAFFAEVVTKEKDPEVLAFARETVDGMGKMRKKVDEFVAEKKRSPQSFAKAYDELYESLGKKGSYDVLAASSSVQDEAKLRALRERILQRNSDEAFYDYQNVNNVIIMNRLMDRMQKGKP